MESFFFKKKAARSHSLLLAVMVALIISSSGTTGELPKTESSAASPRPEPTEAKADQPDAKRKQEDERICGYHCWVEFNTEGKWWPIDISKGNTYSNLSPHFLDDHSTNAVELSHDWDLVVKPGPVLGPIIFFAYPAFEMGEDLMELKTGFSFNRDRETISLSIN
ncbi:MAG: transglutaminase domain-containing protein [Pseudomonadota bacterium]